MTKINFDDVPSGNFDPLPEDRYALECVEAEVSKSKAGNKKIKVQFKVIENEDYNNRRVWNEFSLVPQALFNLKSYFEAAGLSTEGDFEPEELAALMIGSQVSGYVTQETYEGKINNKVGKWVSLETTSESLFK